MRKIISLICTAMILSCLCIVSTAEVLAVDNRCIEGSYLTEQDESYGSSTNSLTKGEFLGTGDCSISKAGRGRIYVYGSTTANTTVDNVAITMMVEQYNEKADKWYQIDGWTTEKSDSYFVSTSKSIVVERGYYYRVHAVHYATMEGIKTDFGNSLTDGIMIP